MACPAPRPEIQTNPTTRPQVRGDGSTSRPPQACVRITIRSDPSQENCPNVAESHPRGKPAGTLGDKVTLSREEPMSPHGPARVVVRDLDSRCARRGRISKVPLERR